MKALMLGLAGLLGLAGAVAFAYLKPPAEATESIQASPMEQTSTGAPGSAEAPRFLIQPGQSQARFVIDEILQGSPRTVVGKTDQVAGQLAVDLGDVTTAQMGTLSVNARTFATDSAQRDRMIKNQILETDRHEYISFVPSDLVGLPRSARVGESFTFQIVGELTIRGETREATFQATVTPESADRLVGSAATSIHHADWGIRIPQVPSVAGVSEIVRLELDFVATAA